MILRKYLLIYLTICIFFNTYLVLANDKISYINVDFLIINSNLGKSISVNLKNLKKKNIDKFILEEKKLPKKNNEINKIKNVISKDELEKKITNLKLEINEFNVLKEQISIQTKKIKQGEIKKFFKKINPLIENYMDENSIDIIIDKKNIFIARSEYDITSDILELINKNFK